MLCKYFEQCQKKSDEEIVKMSKKDKDCYVCLVERYEDKIIRYIRRISNVSQESAEDIAQDVFIKVFINLNEFNEELKFSSWLYRIAHNETINYWRRNKKRKAQDVSWDDNEALKNILRDSRDIEEDVYQKITNQQLKSALTKLDEKYREVLILNYLEGKSYQEIADILKKPIGTVGTLINRAKKFLAKELEKEGISPEVAIRN